MSICTNCAEKLGKPIPTGSCGVCSVCGSSKTCNIKMAKKETYTHKEVENLIKRIINQDSFGDIHHEAGKVQREYNMNFTQDFDDEPDEEEIERIDNNWDGELLDPDEDEY